MRVLIYAGRGPRRFSVPPRAKSPLIAKCQPITQYLMNLRRGVKCCSYQRASELHLWFSLSLSLSLAWLFILEARERAKSSSSRSNATLLESLLGRDQLKGDVLSLEEGHQLSLRMRKAILAREGAKKCSSAAIFSVARAKTKVARSPPRQCEHLNVVQCVAKKIVCSLARSLDNMNSTLRDDPWCHLWCPSYNNIGLHR